LPVASAPDRLPATGAEALRFRHDRVRHHGVGRIARRNRRNLDEAGAEVTVDRGAPAPSRRLARRGRRDLACEPVGSL
jgi:hypothetical protein